MDYGAIFLDVDGVLTDQKANVDSGVCGKTVELARKGKKIAFLTGRSLEWMGKKLLVELVDAGLTQGEAVIFVGEGGAAFGKFDGEKIAGETDNNLAVPRDYVEKAIEETRRFPLLEFDKTKRAMISIEVVHAKMTSPAEMHRAQMMLHALAERFKEWVGDEFAVSTTLYAVDIINKKLSKRNSARVAVEKLEVGGEKILVVGDSGVDLDMGIGLQELGKEFDYYHVGEISLPQAPFPVKRSEKKFFEGTRDILGGVA